MKRGLLNRTKGLQWRESDFYTFSGTSKHIIQAKTKMTPNYAKSSPLDREMEVEHDGGAQLFQHEPSVFLYILFFSFYLLYIPPLYRPHSSTLKFSVESSCVPSGAQEARVELFSILFF